MVDARLRRPSQAELSVDGLCGTIVWVRDQQRRASSTNGPLIGQRIIIDMKPVGTMRWSAGRIYKPEDGRHYAGSLRLRSANTFAVEGRALFICMVQDNPSYQFISDNAKAASRKFGVKSISLVAVKPA